MEPNHYEASEHPSGTAGGVEHKRKVSRGYVLLEVFWISLAIVMTGCIACFCLLLVPFLNDHVSTPAEGKFYTVALVLSFLAFFGDLFVIPTAIGGLFGRMGMAVGAACGLVLFVVGAAWWLSTPFVPNS